MHATPTTHARCVHMLTHRGDNWVGVDGSGAPWQCATGTKQSPIYINPQSGACLAVLTCR
jgi:hypothetical protein